MGEIHINEDAEKEWTDLVNGLKGFKENQERVSKWIAASENKILDATRIKQEMEKIYNQFEAALADQNKVTGELAEWQYLKAACGKKGLQALEIDGVSPVIEAYANDLLISTFGPNNTIRFETVDGEGKEVLNIVVMDADGSETLLENKSGGESVWILKALRLALTLLSKEKSGRNFQTVLMDEEDGALSPKNAVHFINLYRSMMDIGGFETCYYISHKQEAVALANHRLIFNDNGILID
jgi:DNA repair exonuclease SbcCD ATPase subunit